MSIVGDLWNQAELPRELREREYEYAHQARDSECDETKTDHVGITG